MREKLLEAPPEAGAIETYTSDLSRRLRRALPGERADEIVREAEAHLHDQADAIAATCETNVPRQEAEAQAVAAFTPPVAFARDMARSAVETHFSKAWHNTGKVVTSLILCSIIAALVVDGTVVLHPMGGWSASSYSGACCFALLPIACLCAFCARRNQTRHLFGVTALVAALAFFYTGFFYVALPNGDIGEFSGGRSIKQAQYESWRNCRLEVEDDARRLRDGLKIYREKNPVVPAYMKGRNGKGYIATSERIPTAHLAHMNKRDATYYFPLDAKSPETVPTLAEARARWLIDGPEYLAQAQYQGPHIWQRYEQPRLIALRQKGFCAAAATYAKHLIYSGLFLMLFDGVFAKMGRAVYIKRRARRERKASMRKVFLQAPPEEGAITNYTSEVLRSLRPALPGERADEIISEAQAHLYDQAEAIKARENLSQNEAEARAVAAFTPAVQFAQEMAQSAFETRFSKAWHKTGKALAVLLLCIFGALFLTDGIFFIPMSPLYIFRYYGLIYLLLGPTMGVCLCAFLSRRAQTRRLLCSVALLTLLLFVHDGFFSVMSPPVDGFGASRMSRLRMQQLRARHRESSVQVDDDIHLLDAGLKTYGQKNPTVPALLRGVDGRGYLVPYAVTSNMVLAKADPKNTQYHTPFSISINLQGPSPTVGTAAQARARWLKYGPFYLAQARAEKERAVRDEAAMEKALQQTGFSIRAGWWLAAETLRSGLFLVILDWLFAKLGWAIHVKLRARRERKIARA